MFTGKQARIPSCKPPDRSIIPRFSRTRKFREILIQPISNVVKTLSAFPRVFIRGSTERYCVTNRHIFQPFVASRQQTRILVWNRMTLLLNWQKHRSLLINAQLDYSYLCSSSCCVNVDGFTSPRPNPCDPPEPWVRVAWTRRAACQWSLHFRYFKPPKG